MPTNQPAGSGEAVKPCPFCGEPPHVAPVVRGYRAGVDILVRCMTPDCAARLMGEIYGYAWNRRPPLPPSTPTGTERVEEARDAAYCAGIDAEKLPKYLDALIAAAVAQGKAEALRKVKEWVIDNGREWCGAQVVSEPDLFAFLAALSALERGEGA